MHLIEMKDLFCEFVKEFDQTDFDKLMEFLEYVLTEYRRIPVKIKAFLKYPQETKKSLEDFLQLKEGEPRPLALKSTEIPRQKRISLVQTISFNSKDDQIEINEQFKQVFQKEKQKSVPKNPYICPVCNTKPITTYYHGPGVCHPCRIFFITTYSRLKTLKKCATNGNCTRFFGQKQCQSCRLNRCIQVGMQWRGVKNKKTDIQNVESNHVSSQQPTTSNQVALNEDKCVCCERTYNVSCRYGTKLCGTCSNWYCQMRNDSAKMNLIECKQKVQSSKNKCHLLKDFVPKQCTKCRFIKIQQFVKI